MKAKRPATKSLASLKNTAKGEVSHMTIHPATNSKGGRAFTTRVHRTRPADAEAAMAKGGRYIPPPEPEETVHHNTKDMLAHVGKTFGAGDADEASQDMAA